MTGKYTLMLVLFAAAAIAVPPVFDPPVAIEAGGLPINVGYGGNASPFMVDWDGDHKQDLLLGQYDSGKVRFYRNVGEDTAPRFDTFEYLQAGGADISLSYG
jgi:hypothetical protein